MFFYFALDLTSFDCRSFVRTRIAPARRMLAVRECVLMPGIYLFVDGAYLRRLYEDKTSLFGQKSNFDIRMVHQNVNAVRTFYYDCLHDIQKQGESDADFRLRLAEQDARFASIQSAPGVHLRLGSLKGKPPRVRRKSTCFWPWKLWTTAEECGYRNET